RDHIPQRGRCHSAYRELLQGRDEGTGPGPAGYTRLTVEIQSGGSLGEDAKADLPRKGYMAPHSARNLERRNDADGPETGFHDPYGPGNDGQAGDHPWS